MNLDGPSSISFIFLAIAAIFVVAAFRDALKSENRSPIARKIWIRMAFIFCAVSMALYLFDLFF
jgi:hypothetical protein